MRGQLRLRYGDGWVSELFGASRTAGPTAALRPLPETGKLHFSSSSKVSETPTSIKEKPPSQGTPPVQ